MRQRKGQILGSTKPAGKYRASLVGMEDTQAPALRPNIWAKLTLLGLVFFSSQQNEAFLVQTSVFYLSCSLKRRKGTALCEPGIT